MQRRRARRAIGALLGLGIAFASPAAWAATPGRDITPNNDIPGVDELRHLAGGLMMLGLVGAGIGLMISLAGLGVASHTHNLHLRERFKNGAGISLLATAGFGAANALLSWVWGVGSAIGGGHP
jgi:hypothetical protein